MTKIFVPAPGRRIQMPGHQPDWPEDGQPIDELDNYQRRLVAEGALVPKKDQPARRKTAGKGART